eukprot:TRINITY_DN1805_c0_g1_i2.p1 TRINITY_DN1805_c0_g1~~TRINITY_DN1805_c0_g1_i2.p1  ORF type:complete len:231 (-),score=82.48 TRINITY_DN1805_c0_g1_i2:15-707(-)
MMSFDVVFVKEQHVTAYPNGILDWMKYNFDFQICANAITPTGAYCIAPHEIARRVAYLRQDQYCCSCDNEEPFCLPPEVMKFTANCENRWPELDYPPCNCENIIPRRIQKYQKRGYKVVLGEWKNYQELQEGYVWEDKGEEEVIAEIGECKEEESESEEESDYGDGDEYGEEAEEEEGVGEEDEEDEEDEDEDEEEGKEELEEDEEEYGKAPKRKAETETGNPPKKAKKY